MEAPGHVPSVPSPKSGTAQRVDLVGVIILYAFLTVLSHQQGRAGEGNT